MAEEVNIKASFGVIKSEERYLKDRIDVTDKRRKVQDTSYELTYAQKRLDESNIGTPGYQYWLTQYKKLVNDLDAAKKEQARVEAIAKADYRKAYKKETGFASEKEKKAAEAAKEIDSQIEVEQNVLQRLQDTGQDTTVQQSKIQDLIDKKNRTGKYASEEEKKKQQEEQQQSQDINAVLESAPKYLFDLKDKDRRLIAQSLKDAGYNVPVTGIYNDALKNAYVQAILENNQRNTETKRNQTVELFLVEKAREEKTLDSAKGPGKPTPGSVSISTPTEAAGLITAAFKANGFDNPPTPEQIKTFTERLNKEEKKFSSVTRPVKRVVNGKEYIEYVGGIDRNQFLNELVQALPQYSERKKNARTLTLQDLAKTARANGLDLQKDFGDTADNWVRRVENGEDVDIFKNMIRSTARLGMPERVSALMDQGMDLDSIYAPYKRVMASTLEITPDSISLNDPTLRMAIGPDKEMTIYDFEKNLRKDTRWQYTDNARKEVADATLKVLQDFGFVG